MATINAWGSEKPAQVAMGGSGATTFTDHGILLGSAAAAFTVTAEPSNGQLLIGSTGNDPVLASLTAGANITITPGAGSISIASTASGGITFEEVTDAAKAAAVDKGYIINRAAGCTVTLPDTAALGSVIEIIGKDGIWVLAQNAGETVYFGNQNTTAGVGGSITATHLGDCIRIVCITADTSWRVVSSVGNLTIA